MASLYVLGRGGAGGFVASMEMLTRAPVAVLARAVAAGEGTTAEGIAAAVVVTAAAEKAAPVFPKSEPDT